jgi:hypothetical protein
VGMHEAAGGRQVVQRELCTIIAGVETAGTQVDGVGPGPNGRTHCIE